MAKPTIFDYAREATRAELNLLMLFDSTVEPNDEAELDPPKDDACKDAAASDPAE